MLGYHHIEFINRNHHFEKLSQEEYNAFINPSNNKNIIIQKADKGNTVVIMDRANYILPDTNNFLKVICHPKHKVNKEI